VGRGRKAAELTWSYLVSMLTSRFTSPVRWLMPTPLTSMMPNVWSIWRPAMREHTGNMNLPARSYSCGGDYVVGWVVWICSQGLPACWSILIA
jgi:hypothetical protein